MLTRNVSMPPRKTDFAVVMSEKCRNFRLVPHRSASNHCTSSSRSVGSELEQCLEQGAKPSGKNRSGGWR